MSSESDVRLNLAIEEYLASSRKGQILSVEELVTRFPEQSDELRGLLPLLGAFREVRDVNHDSSGTSFGSHCDAGSDVVEHANCHPERLGDFRILGKIGQGGMGVVYEAIEETLGRRVALKTLPSSAKLDPRRLERFRREARSAGALHHTNIVPVFGLHEHGDLLFYTMQHIDGCGLDEVVGLVRIHSDEIFSTNGDSAGILDAVTDAPKDDGANMAAGPTLTSTQLSELAPSGGSRSSPLEVFRCALKLHNAGKGRPASIRDASDERANRVPSGSSASSSPGRIASYLRFIAGLGQQAASALEYAHQQGVLHRDIKPSNLLLDRHGTVWITDFGLAKIEGSDELTETGELVGTCRFMSPEGFDGEVSASSDIYGLGVTLYELLTLEPAFNDAGRRRLIERIALEPPCAPRRIEPEIPRDLENIVLRAIEKRPEDRYKSAAALALDLTRFLEGRPVAARHVGSLERSWRWCRRNPTVTALGGIVGVLLAMVAVVSTISATRLQSRLRETYLAQAQAVYSSSEPGRRWRALDALAQAAEIEPGGDLRNAALGAMQHLVDLRPGGQHYRAEESLLGPRIDGTLSRLAHGDENGAVHVRSLPDGRELFVDSEFGWKSSAHITFTPDGHFLALARPSRLRIWDVDNRSIAFEWSASSLSSRLARATFGDAAVVRRVNLGVYARADSREIAFGSDHNLFLLDLESFALRRIPLGEITPPGEARTPGRIAWSPDASRIAVLFYLGKTTLILRREDGKLLHTLRDKSRLRNLAWHATLPYLATVSEPRPRSTIRIWDGRDGTLRSSILGPGEVMDRLSFLRGPIIVGDAWDGRTHLFDLRTGKSTLHTRADRAFVSNGGDSLVLTLGRDVTFFDILVPDAYRVLRATNAIAKGVIRFHPRWPLVLTMPAGKFWDTRSGAVIASLGRSLLRDAFFTPDGTKLVSVGPHGVEVWPLEEIPAADSHTLRVGPPRRVSAWRDGEQTTFAHDGSAVFHRTQGAGKSTGSVVLRIELDSGKMIPVHASEKKLGAISVSPDGKWLAAGGAWGQFTRTLLLVDLENDRSERVEFGVDAKATFGPNDRHLVVATRDRYYVLERGSFRRLLTITPRVGGYPGGVAFSPDGGMLAILDSRSSIRLVELESGDEMGTLDSPDDIILGLPEFHPSGTHLAAFPKLWDLRRLRAGLAAMQLDWPRASIAEPAFEKNGNFGSLQVKLIPR